MKIDYYIDTFNYFKILHPDIIKGSVLDYGSNYGMFLDSSKGNFSQSTYTGIDVDYEAIKSGKNQFPLARFIHYNRYNHVYNPSGTIGEIPQLDESFDTVISYSVFTHASVEDMLEMIAWLYDRTKVGGKLLLSWLDIDNKDTTEFFYNKRKQSLGYCESIITDDYIYLNDNKLSKQIEETTWSLLFFKKDYLSKILFDYNYKIVSAPKNVEGCFQSCIIIYKV